MSLLDRANARLVLLEGYLDQIEPSSISGMRAHCKAEVRKLRLLLNLPADPRCSRCGFATCICSAAPATPLD